MRALALLGLLAIAACTVITVTVGGRDAKTQQEAGPELRTGDSKDDMEKEKRDGTR